MVIEFPLTLFTMAPIALGWARSKLNASKSVHPRGSNVAIYVKKMASVVKSLAVKAVDLAGAGVFLRGIIVFSAR